MFSIYNSTNWELSQKAEKRYPTVPLNSRVICSFPQPHMVTEAPSLTVLVLTKRTVPRSSLANNVWGTWRLPDGSHQYPNFSTSYSVYDHTIGNTPVLVRSPKLSPIGRGWYLDGGPPGNTPFCRLTFSLLSPRANGTRPPMTSFADEVFMAFFHRLHRRDVYQPWKSSTTKTGMTSRMKQLSAGRSPRSKS